MIKTKIEEWAILGNELISKSRKCLAGSPNKKMKMLAEKVPQNVFSESERLNIVFAGQYSAGKSTIITALTGRKDILIGSGITTEKAHDYDWNGIHIWDTPGIHTELRPDHDEITYKAISEADLLVFVTTNELFDSHIAEHFRKLAIERQKAHEMMLVVNKMRRCARGNTLEVRNIIREDLRKVVNPVTPEELYLTFIDAASFLAAEKEENHEIADALRKKSGFDDFVQELNRFVGEKGLTSKYTTELYKLEHILQEALAEESTGDTDIDALEELLLQKRRALLDTQIRIPQAVEGEIQNTTSQIRHKGRELAEMINGNIDSKAVNHALKVSQAHIQDLSNQLSKSIQLIIGKQLKTLDKRIADIAESELAKELILSLQNRLEKISISPETTNTLKKVSGVSSQLGKFLIEHSFNSKGGALSELFKLNQYSGTAAHEFIKTAGKIFGKSFKPWEAVKWTRTLANAGRVFAIAGTVLTFILDIKEWRDEAKREEELRGARTALRSGFNDTAHAVETYFDKTTQSFIAKTLSSEIENVDSELKELQTFQKTRSDLFQRLHDLLSKTRSLIKQIHSQETK